ncbi:MAG: hypothetical protein NUW37_18630 [Planctomycetes bacterium]|nr:hypothetical protein [Planctomycetota bacterium]
MRREDDEIVDLYSRHLLLRGAKFANQLEILKTVVRVSGASLAAEVVRLYLAKAGFSISDSSPPSETIEIEAEETVSEALLKAALFVDAFLLR